MRNVERGNTVSINMSNDDECYEAAARQEEIYLEVTEEDVRAILTSDDPSPIKVTAEYWQEKLEELELGWKTTIDDRRN